MSLGVGGSATFCFHMIALSPYALRYKPIPRESICVQRPMSNSHQAPRTTHHAECGIHFAKMRAQTWRASAECKDRTTGNMEIQSNDASANLLYVSYFRALLYLPMHERFDPKRGHAGREDHANDYNDGDPQLHLRRGLGLIRVLLMHDP
jgi:hypothetical protein